MSLPMSCLCLAQHADYRCQHSGACCTSNWPIHVESGRVGPIRAALADGRLELPQPEAASDGGPLVADGELPPGAAAVLRTTSSGACAFYDRAGRRCAIHRALGHSSLPSACQHFPRRCLIERDAVFVSLSHYCPTVAAMTFDGRAARGVIAAPVSLTGHLQLEGLDAREALPPLLRPGMLTDVAGYHAWESAVVALLEEEEAAEDALARAAHMTQRLMDWNPGRGPLAAAVEQAAAACRAKTVPAGRGFAEEGALVAAFEIARMSVPEPMRPAAARSGVCERDARWVAPAWPRFSGPVGRFLAAHAFASWCAYLGAGLGTVLRSLETALAVVRVEAGRLCDERSQMLDREIAVDAFRAADLLLVHLADPKALATALDAKRS